MPRLLIIDDDDAMRKVLRFRLKDSYEIIDTGSPEEALALASITLFLAMVAVWAQVLGVI